eukprot:TRINITY_DN9214_c1_g1_i1.p2 TRINITY_DN9214_c1_g1~~TRINITY_DN9214_c1_g1_i1.p2  ORF type:complete len:248 (-),score=63.85 TRINITY_DN9214_c1_g1_i1:107-802(-)
MSKSVLVYGGAGQLGAAVVTAFVKATWSVVSVDLRESSDATKSVVLANSGDLESDVKGVRADLGEDKFDAVVCVAGGWAGGNAKSDGFLKSFDFLWKCNMQSAMASSNIAAHTLKENGMFVLTGAQAALGPTAGMISYGITKAATHHLVSSLADKSGGLPDGASVAAILPITLDTATNRSGMPTADFTSWTPLEDVANVLVEWAEGKNRPATGTLVTVKTEASKTTFTPVQ